MEVTVGGVAVADGATLSTTGEMQVTCNVPYVLSVDGVEWVPTASQDGVDSYLLSTGGVVRIFINGTRYFMFTNTITADFTFGKMDVYLYTGENYVSHNDLDSYYQGHMMADNDSLVMNIFIDSVNPAMSREELVALGASCTQGNVTVEAPSWNDSLVFVRATGFDTSVYNAVFLGNVLLAFFEPAE